MSTPAHGAPQVLPYAYPLDDFYAQQGLTLPVIDSVAGEDVPQPYRSLLVHDDDMTPTLEHFHGGQIHVTVLRRQQRGDFYYREVVLSRDTDNAPVEFGAIKIMLNLFPAAARQAVLSERTPLGTRFSMLETIREFALARLHSDADEFASVRRAHATYYADLSNEYFGEASQRVTYRSACISIAIANFVGFLFGGMPLCHGAGGLAAHHRFGARTAGSNLLIGVFFILLIVFFGDRILAVLYLLPMSILGVLLIFAGGQLALTVIDLKDRKGLFVAVMMLGITLASNLAAGFLAGLVIAYLLKSERLSV